MDNKHFEFTFEYGFSSGYSLRLLTDESRVAYLPQLVMVYLRMSGYPLEMLEVAQQQFYGGEVFLLFDAAGQVQGIIPFDNIGVRKAAQGHMAFQVSVPSGVKQEAAKLAMDVMIDIGLLRVDIFFPEHREDIVKFLEAVGAEYVGTVPYAAFDLEGVIVPQLYYVYRGEA